MEEVLLYSKDGKTLVGVKDKTVAHISIPSGIERIEDEAFSDCFNLYDVDIADSIIEIGSRSFFRCSSLNSIKLPNGIVKLGEGAFSGCVNLCKIDIPKRTTLLLMWKRFNMVFHLHKSCHIGVRKLCDCHKMS